MEEDHEWFDVPDSSELGIAPKRLRLLADVHVPRAFVSELRKNGIEITTAQEEGASSLDDPELFRHARKQGRVLLTMDAGFWSERRFPVSQGGGIVVLEAGPQEADKAISAFAFAYAAFMQAYGALMTDGIRVKATMAQFFIRFRSHEGRNVTYAIRVHRGNVQAKEVPL